jgi:arginine exporter protein ArgO
VKIFFKIVLVLFILWVCAVVASIFAGVAGALVAVLLHAGPFAITMIVRILGTIFFFGFALLAWVIYSRRRARRQARKTEAA